MKKKLKARLPLYNSPPFDHLRLTKFSAFLKIVHSGPCKHYDGGEQKSIISKNI